jgi:hypothetical protein
MGIMMGQFLRRSSDLKSGLKQKDLRSFLALTVRLGPENNAKSRVSSVLTNATEQWPSRRPRMGDN